MEAPRILLVEDYAPNVLVATTFLEMFGYTSDVVENGVDAIAAAATGKYAAALMDVSMGDMSGLEATQRIREDETKTGRSRLPIIGMTAHVLVGDREKCLSAGMDDYLTKPFAPEELERKLSHAVSGGYKAA